MVIYPEVQATPDAPTIRFRQPREQVDLEKELPRILHAQGWSCGTYLNVQFLNHERTKLLACARFVVTEETETVQTSDANPYQPMTKTVFSRRAEQVGEWWTCQSQNLDMNLTEIVRPSLDGSSAEAPAARRGRPPKTAVA